MSTNKLRIIIVDDEPIIRLDLQTMIEKAGYDVVGECADGFEAIRLCRKEKPDVAILDIRMTDLDGFSAAKIINKDCPMTAIIMLTAYSKGEYIEKAKECNINSYLVKPVTEQMLIPNIELAVARKKEVLQYEQDIIKAKEILESRKVVDRAKGILMTKRDINEDEAYNYIRTISENNNMAMAKVAAIILDKYRDIR